MGGKIRQGQRQQVIMLEIDTGSVFFCEKKSSRVADGNEMVGKKAVVPS